MTIQKQGWQKELKMSGKKKRLIDCAHQRDIPQCLGGMPCTSRWPWRYTSITFKICTLTYDFWFFPGALAWRWFWFVVARLCDVDMSWSWGFCTHRGRTILLLQWKVITKSHITELLQNFQEKIPWPFHNFSMTERQNSMTRILRQTLYIHHENDGNLVGSLWCATQMQTVA